MRTRTTAITLALTVLASAALAHVPVRPRESQPGATEKYVVRVPTEGKVPTTSIVLDGLQGVTIASVAPMDGLTSDMTRETGRVMSITWTVTMNLGENRECTFVAKNPSDAAEIGWKAHQRYADGTSSEWVGAGGTRQPAPSPH